MTREQLAMLKMFDRHVESSAQQELGVVAEKTDIQTSIGPFKFLPDYRITYPRIIIRALGELYEEYNKNFIPLAEANMEWKTDYQYCYRIKGLTPINFAVQVDMVGLPDSFLQIAEDEEISQEEIREILRMRIFEIENSLAMYQLLEKIFSSNGQNSFFKINFRSALSKLRKKFQKPIALLAVTEQKHQAMLSSEFGKQAGESVSDAEVSELSGFDRFFGPDDFRKYLMENKGRCDYLLYARTSDPVSRLKDPSLQVEHPLLGDPEMRKVIKANVLTFNIDSPEMDSSRRINDTKEYQPRMKMAFPISSGADLFSLDFAEFLLGGKKGYATYTGSSRLSSQFRSYLHTCGIDPQTVESGETLLRCKPAKCAYGCYGHVVGSLNDNKFRGELRNNMRQREGGYVVQPEMKTPVIENITNGQAYTYIDRNFLLFTGGKPHFAGGFRSLMPVDCHEAKKHRNHGNGSTVWAEIVA